MKKSILVVDFGTSNVRAIAFDTANGAVLASHSRKYTTLSPEPSYLELAPKEIWSLSVECVKTVMDQISGSAAVEALNFSYIGTSLFCLDENLEPTYNCILCFDPRAESEAAEMAKLFQTPTYRFSKWAPSAKIIWLHKNMPEVYEKTRYFWSIQQYILAKLGLEPAWDPTMANLHYMFDPSTNEWNQKIFDYVGIGMEKVATTLLGSEEIVGKVDNYGGVSLNAEVPVLTGTHDGDISMVGLGVMGEKEDVIGEASGTFDHIGFIADNDPNRVSKTWWKPGPIKNTVVLMYGFSTYGAVVEWFVNTFYDGDSSRAYKDLWEHCVFDGSPNKVFVNPAFSGRGTFSGMDLTTTKYDLFKATIEALTFETRRSMEVVQESKHGDCNRIRMGGGPAASDEWTQLRANITGKTIERIVNNDTSALGAAVVAAISIGMYKDLKESVDHMVAIKDAFHPDPALQEIYNQRYQEYIAKLPVKS